MYSTSNYLQIMTPFILRRLKADVQLNLPPKQELMVYAPLSKLQRELYEATVNRSIDQLLNKPGKVSPYLQPHVIA